MDISKAICELLYENPAVIVPGLGGFTSSPAPATVDYVQGMVLPPTKKIDFNPNLVINDGMLVHHIQGKETITFQEAREAVERYVEDVKGALDRREIVEIGELGRIYKDYEHKIRFMPEDSNFNMDAFGLPNVAFTPLVRERPATAPEPKKPKPAVAAAATATASSASTAAASNGAQEVQEEAPAVGFLQRMLPWLVLLGAILLAFSIYLAFREDGSQQAAKDAAAKERTNVKPPTETETNAAGTGSAALPEDNAAANTPTAPTNVPPTATPPVAEKPTNTPPTSNGNSTSAGKQEAFIVVHSFGSKENATKFSKQLSDAGYAADIHHVGNLYRTGINFPYKSQSDIDEVIAKLGKKFKASPKIFEDGL